MADILRQILADKYEEVAASKRARPASALQDLADFHARPRDFFSAAATPRNTGPALIAEIKGRSPSAGVIREPLHVAEIAISYERAGAAAISVLTDAKYFGGAPENLAIAKKACGLPVLRKEFIVDDYQILASRALGADAILLIGEALPLGQILDFAHAAATMGLAVLIEGHSADVLLPIVEGLRRQDRGGVLIGINNRDLTRQVTDLAIFENVAAALGGDFPLVAESGLRNRMDVERVWAAGAASMLIGEAILQSSSLERMIQDLLGFSPQ
ncbi:MAG: indole-3-glycerol-phosphate synthase [Phycisphaerae bacterium]